MALLDGKVMIVSGVGPGLGTQIALSAADAGASVVLGARSREYLVEVAGTIEAAGGSVAWSRCDITVPEECDAIVRAAVDRFGGVDSVVHNAYHPGPMESPVETADLDEWRAVFEVNLFGSLQLTKAAVEPMRRRGGGSVVFVNSQIVRRVLPGRGAYATSKAALMTAAQVLARELGPSHIRVNSVVPGRMWGPPFKEAYEKRAAAQGKSLDEILEPVRALIALADIPTDVECAGAALFLASDLSIAMTGQAIDVNGGETFH